MRGRNYSWRAEMAGITVLRSRWKSPHKKEDIFGIYQLGAESMQSKRTENTLGQQVNFVETRGLFNLRL